MNFEHEDSKVDKEFKLPSLKMCCRFVIMAIKICAALDNEFTWFMKTKGLNINNPPQNLLHLMSPGASSKINPRTFNALSDKPYDTLYQKIAFF